MGSPFESATFGPEFPPIQSSHREGEEEVSLHSASTDTQEESASLLFLDQDLGLTDKQKESQSLLKKEKVDEESNRVKLSAKLCNGMFSWRLDPKQDNI